MKVEIFKQKEQLGYGILFADISGDINYKFDNSRRISLIRITGTKEGHYDRFNNIRIGDKTFNYGDLTKDDWKYLDPKRPSWVYTLQVKDYNIETEFNKGDNFIVEHNNCINSLILFIK